MAVVGRSGQRGHGRRPAALPVRIGRYCSCVGKLNSKSKQASFARTGSPSGRVCNKLRLPSGMHRTVTTLLPCYAPVEEVLAATEVSTSQASAHP
jgi:hypothetical protein